ncbi:MULTISPECIES: recombinase family protein [Actinomadura]|uniref:Recombinase family protein n=1 Tax=Actinomadura yumaensis TaxID=111807 RepID=A0ABW2CIG4_9ACTN|nr:recombinase family protein [Actinomadura sp. J1-007]MWK37159.1 hypothetical protein [Actinomadura sp. J1-007]
MLAVFAEFEAALLKMRTREGMAVARPKGKLKGKKSTSPASISERRAPCSPAAGSGRSWPRARRARRSSSGSCG